MKLDKTIGFLGCGNMGGAILSGLVRRKIARPGNIFVYDLIPAKLKAAGREFKVRVARNVSELVKNSRVLVLAVKPQDFQTIAPELRNLLTENKLVITILAGVPLPRIRKALGRRPALVRAMPNLAAVIGESVTALAGSPKDLKTAEIVFSGCGEMVRLPERLFDAVTALSGSGPAYFFYLIESLVEAGRQCGLSSRDAELLVKQTAKGAALLASRSGEPVELLRKRVTSKGGTTEAALTVFENMGFPNMVRLAVKRAVRRAQALGRG
jgi:pyrroline-5-carboxylate reductase